MQRGRRAGGAPPRGLQVLLDPVTMPCCGKSFDKACIDKHLEARPHAAACPVCRKALPAEAPPVRARALGACARGGVAERRGRRWSVGGGQHLG